MNGDSITGPKLVIMLNDMPLTTDMEKTRTKKKKGTAVFQIKSYVPFQEVS